MTFFLSGDYIFIPSFNISHKSLHHTIQTQQLSNFSGRHFINNDLIVSQKVIVVLFKIQSAFKS